MLVRRVGLLVAGLSIAAGVVGACSSGDDQTSSGLGGSGGASSGPSGMGGDSLCGCFQSKFTPCVDGVPGDSKDCPAACDATLGCVDCVPGATTCDGNKVEKCGDDGKSTGEVVKTCDASKGEICRNGACGNACDLTKDDPSNVGCEFWAVDLDQQDAMNDPASAPWGIVLSNAAEGQAQATIEINDAPVGQPIHVTQVMTVTVPPGGITPVILPTRELDCGTKPNDYASPGTCLSSRAYRITSTNPIVVYQFNVFANAYSNDASLLLPTTALGKLYRVIGWVAGHPIPTNIPTIGKVVDRSYITVVGTKPNTKVTVKPSWRIKGNAPIAATAPGGSIQVTIGPFDVLNLETDDAKFSDDPKTVADLSGSSVEASQPVAVFSGVESTGAPGGVLEVPTPPGWESGDNCCLDHLEDQLLPMESIGTHYVVPRSAIRSTGSFREADIVRFVGVAEPAMVTTSLPAPFDSFQIQPGQVMTTWTQNDFVATSTKPVMIGQILVSNEYVDGPPLGDPSLTVLPPVEQFRKEYVILSPDGWTKSWIVIEAPVDAEVTLDGAPATACTVETSGMMEGVAYESRRCQVASGAHKLAAKKPFGIVAYGYGSAGSYALVGGAAVKHVYDPPPIP